MKSVIGLVLLLTLFVIPSYAADSKDLVGVWDCVTETRGGTRIAAQTISFGSNGILRGEGGSARYWVEGNRILSGDPRSPIVWEILSLTSRELIFNTSMGRSGGANEHCSKR